MEPGTEHKLAGSPGPQAALMKSVCNRLIVPPLVHLLILLIPKQLKVIKLKINWLWLKVYKVELVFDSVSLHDI